MTLISTSFTTGPSDEARTNNSEYKSRSWHSIPNPKHLIRIEEELSNLNSSSPPLSSITTPQELGNLNSKLVTLSNLYHLIEKLLSCSSTQQSLLRHDHGRLVEQALDASVIFLGVVGRVRDIISVMKDRLCDLQSALRRRVGLGDTRECNTYAKDYVEFRKSSNKEITEVMRELEKMIMMKKKKKLEFDVSIMDSTTRLGMMAKVLREVAATTAMILRSLLISFSVPIAVAGTSKTKRQLQIFMSRIGVKGQLGYSTVVRSEVVIKEVGSVDLALCSLSDISDDLVIQERMMTLETGLRSMENSLDGLSRSLVKYRVSFLNMLAN